MKKGSSPKNMKNSSSSSSSSSSSAANGNVIKGNEKPKAKPKAKTKGRKKNPLDADPFGDLGFEGDDAGNGIISADALLSMAGNSLENSGVKDSDLINDML